MNKFRLPAGKTGLIKFIDRLCEGDKQWVCTIEPYREKRTLSQNALLWGVVYPQVATFFGGDVTKDDVHDALGDMFLPTETNPIDGRSRRVSTTKLSKRQFADYIEAILAWAATEHGLHVEV